MNSGAQHVSGKKEEWAGKLSCDLNGSYHSKMIVKPCVWGKDRIREVRCNLNQAFAQQVH